MFGIKNVSYSVLELPDFRIAKRQSDGMFEVATQEGTAIVKIKLETQLNFLQEMLGDFLVTPKQAQDLLGISYAKLSGYVKNCDLFAYGASERNSFKLSHILQLKERGEVILTHEERAELGLDEEDGSEEN